MTSRASSITCWSNYTFGGPAACRLYSAYEGGMQQWISDDGQSWRSTPTTIAGNTNVPIADYAPLSALNTGGLSTVPEISVFFIYGSNELAYYEYDTGPETTYAFRLVTVPLTLSLSAPSDTIKALDTMAYTDSNGGASVLSNPISSTSDLVPC